jgi:aspartyl-tRNA(Asn)/glutamyl-tRNA(Gln) amidotransferase subunit A
MDRYTMKKLRTMLDEKETSSEELVREALTKIEEDNKRDDKLNGFISVLKDYALFQSKEADKEMFSNKAPESKPFLGIPIAIKDLINLKDNPTTCGSRMLENHTSIYDAYVTKELIRAGAIIIGKTNMDEFAMGSSNETSYFGVTRNPYNREHTSGGSSGGSASVVGADFVTMALGSDTGGSIRLPAAFCGVVGMKPTYGRVSRYGLVAFASSFDQIGPITANIEDCAVSLRVIAGYDKKDSTSVKRQVPNYLKTINNDIQGKKVGVPKEFFTKRNSPDVDQAVKKALKAYEQMGCEIVDISLPHTEYGIPAYYLINTAEASSNLARYDGVRYGFRRKGEDITDMYKKTRGGGFSAEVKRRILLGAYALSAGYYEAYYKKAQQVRTLIRQDFQKAFDKIDVIVSPTTSSTAFKLGAMADDPLAMYMNDVYTVPANLAGIPALSMPYGTDADGLPIGVQIMASYFEEGKVLNFARKLEESLQ